MLEQQARAWSPRGTFESSSQVHVLTVVEDMQCCVPSYIQIVQNDMGQTWALWLFKRMMPFCQIAVLRRHDILCNTVQPLPTAFEQTSRDSYIETQMGVAYMDSFAVFFSLSAEFRSCSCYYFWNSGIFRVQEKEFYHSHVWQYSMKQ